MSYFHSKEFTKLEWAEHINRLREEHPALFDASAPRDQGGTAYT